VCKVASASGIDLELSDRLPINEVTKQAFDVLGEGGLIRSADGHVCAECTHEYRQHADMIAEGDAAAVAGIDENHNVPAFEGDVAVDADGSREALMDIDEPQDPMQIDGDHGDHELSPVKMMDGIVMGDHHCAFEHCTSELANARCGVFCEEHETTHGHLCQVKNCQNHKAAGIHTCHQHQALWHAHVLHFGHSTPLGIRCILRRTEAEHLPWLPEHGHQVQPHDEPAPERGQRNYFVAPRFYCVETICAPCGVVIAWAKFAKAESPTQILNFLDRVYPDPDLKPDYVCIDKACLVLQHAIASGRWDDWQDTTWFIVDSYHYINHHTSDYLCRKYCNPAPLNGSAPNLVVVEHDNNGQPHYKHAFNTQVLPTSSLCSQHD
jgi:hypothetical protein